MSYSDDDDYYYEDNNATTTTATTVGYNCKSTELLYDEHEFVLYHEHDVGRQQGR